MAIKVFFLLGFIGLASSTLPHGNRICDTPQEGDEATVCTNHKNILATYEKNKKLKEALQLLDDIVDELQERTGNNSIFLEGLAKNVTRSRTEIISITTHQQSEINHLKEEVSKLVKHKNHVTENLNKIEQRLELTENQLEEKNARLQNLENKTEAASATRRLLSLYERELSKLNTTTRNLEDKVEAQLNVTKTDLGDELRTIQKKNAGFSDRLDRYEAEFSRLEQHTNSSLGDVNQQLKTHKHTINLLQDETTDLASKLQLTTKKLQTEVNPKVAFSATIIDSPRVFTGPGIAGSKSVLIFDKVFTNIGNAYNKHKGVFTAPVKGVYQFTFMTFGYHNRASGAILMKNGHYQVSTWEFAGTDFSDTTSNTVILELKVGDCVNINLWQGGKIHTSVFSGFLIFPLM